MKGAVAFFWGTVLAFAGCASAALAGGEKLERVSVAGHDYIRLRDWVRVNQLEALWLQQGKKLRVSSGLGSVVLTGDSRTAVINGINVWLSHPVVVREDKMLVALQDLRTAIVPLLFPNRSAGTVRLVALDPGHGGKDKGYFRRTQFEKNYTLLLAQEVRNQLILAGLKATLTRSADAYVELSERSDVAKQRKADLFVSLHFNSAGESNHEAKGVEVYCATPVGASSTNTRGNGGNRGPVVGNLWNDRSVLLAWHLQKALVTKLGLEDRGVRRARFQVLSEAAMPAVLIEGGFLSHPSESKRIFDAAFRRQMAKAISDGIVAYKRGVESERELKLKR